MSNHITNRLTIHGSPEKVMNILDAIKNDEIDAGSLDFGKITPMPPWVWNKGGLGRETEQKYGAENCWYDWCINNWGTKWNTYGFDHLGHYNGETHQTDFDKLSAEEYFKRFGSTIEFQTAWSAPVDLMKKLSMMYPDNLVGFCWADEDMGSNVGEVEFSDGQAKFENIPSDQSKEAYEVFSRVNDTNAEDNDLMFDEHSGTYEWHDNAS